MNDHGKSIRRRLRKLKTSPAPDLWRHLATVAVGGLAAVGFTSDSNFLLALSTGGGRSLHDSRTGERVARDDDPELKAWMSTDNVTAAGIGPAEGQQIHVAGLWGGGLSAMTSDRWSCTVVAPDWPIEQVVLQPPGADVIIERSASGCVQVADLAATELRAAGFSSNGKTFVVATSADITLWTRD